MIGERQRPVMHNRRRVRRKVLSSTQSNTNAPERDRAALNGSLPAESPEAIYRERAAEFAARRDATSQRWNLLGNARLLLFALVVVAAGFALSEGSLVIAAIAAALFVLFVGLVAWHRRLRRERRALTIRTEINTEALSRLARDWETLPLRHTTAAPPDHPYANDLDLFGRASLRQLLDQPLTPAASAVVDRWLLAPSPRETIAARQGAIADLAPRLELRETLMANAYALPRPAPDTEPLLAWAESEPWLTGHGWLRLVAWLSPALLVAAIVAQAGGVIGIPLWIVVIGFNVLLTYTVGNDVYERLSAVAAHHGALDPFASSFAVITAEEFTAPRLMELRQEMLTEGVPAAQQLHRLGRLANRVIPRSAIAYLFIQALTLWDLHLLTQLERWQAASGRSIRTWLTNLGEIEALACFGTLTFDNPDWTFPDLEPAAERLDAQAIAHPLLPATGRVANDVSVGPAGTFLLVTGSNMSGKSTLLRAIGVNIVLAQAGGPVCARQLTLPPVELWTCIRVADSLERGVSFFMAELQRLKLIVDAANQHEAGTPPVFYVLDEILQGTNTAEREIAARRIIATLVERGALGAVTTHDLSLAAAPPLDRMAQPVHFTETFESANGARTMTFDYHLRPGLATSTNALKLLELVGFDLVDGAAIRKGE